MTPRKLFTTAEVAAELGLHPARVRALARHRGLGTRYGTRMRLFTSDDVDAMRIRKPGRPKREDVK